MKIQLKYILTGLLGLFIIGVNLIAQDSVGSGNSNPPPDAGEVVLNSNTALSDFGFKLSVIVLIFGFLILLMEIYLIKTCGIHSDDAIKILIITLIIVGTLYLISAGYNNDQIAPATGLLGTIAGYLLGRMQSSAPKTQKDE